MGTSVVEGFVWYGLCASLSAQGWLLGMGFVGENAGIR